MSMRALIFLFLAVFRFVSLGGDWTLATPYSTGANLRSVAFGNGTYVAVGDNYSAPKGIIIFSQDDGQTWKPAATTDNALAAVAFGNGIFVAGGSGSQIYRSADAKHWEATNVIGLAGVTNLAFGNGVFVGTTLDSFNLQSFSSRDGKAWRVISTSSYGESPYLAFGNGKFEIILSRGALNTSFELFSSTDGESWTQSNSAFPANAANYPCNDPTRPCIPVFRVNSFAFGNGVFAAPATGGICRYGCDSYPQWYMETTEANWAWAAPGGLASGSIVNGYVPRNSLFFDGSNFVEMYPAKLTARISSNLVDWSTLALPFSSGFFSGGSTDPQPMGVAYSDGSKVIVGTAGYIAVGSNITALTQVGVASNYFPKSVVTFAGSLFAVADKSSGSTIIYSRDLGRHWSEATLPAGVLDLSRIAFDSGKMIAVGSQGTLIRSTNGVVWTRRLSNVSHDFRDVAFGGGICVGVGDAGSITRSPDSFNFTLGDSGTQMDLNGVTYGAAEFVAVGVDGAILNSIDGIAWTARGTDEAITLNGVAYGNGRYVAVGEVGITHVSTDLSTWRATQISGVGRLSRVGFARGIFVAIEDGTSRIFESADGIQWTPNVLPANQNRGLDVSGGAVWALGAPNSFWTQAPESGTEISLRAELDTTGHVRLTIFAPGAGTYRILSASEFPSSNWTERDALPIFDHAEWIELAPMMEKTFYRVRQE